MTISRPRLLLGVVALALGAGSCSPAFDEPDRAPNVVVFLADDLGWGDPGCYGHPLHRTPHIDRLAVEGMRFTDFHSAGTVCSPSRASLLTGRHPYRLGFYYILGGGAHLRLEEVTVATLLREAGYDTCFVGKWHLTDLDRPARGQPTPGDHGFDHWFATTLNAFDGPENPGKFHRNGAPVDEVEGWYCDVIVDEAIDWLARRPEPGQPFFLLVCSHEPHTPIAPPEAYSAMYDDSVSAQQEADVRYGGVPRPDDRDLAGNAKYYRGTVSQLDAAFGRLVAAVDEAGWRDDTLILFTSDNGPEYPVNFLESRGQWDDPIRDRCFGSPGPWRGMKRFTYEGGHRVPGIVSWPGRVPAGEVSDVLVNGTDLLPTLCELAGIPVPADRPIDGESIVPALEGQAGWVRSDPVCWNFPVHEYAFVPPMTMRDSCETLVAWFEPKPPDQSWMDWIKTTRPARFELYDLRRDPGQTEDLADLLPARTKELSLALAAQWSDIQTEAPVWPEWKAR